MRFRLNSPDVVQELIDGEVIVVHLTSGTYYSLTGSGAAVWAQIIGGATEEAIVAGVASSVSTDRDVVSAGLRRFVAELESERLIVPGGDAASDPAVAGVLPPNGAREPFVPPSIQKYSDMQDLLLVDPIHEVDPTGWPARPGASK